MLIYRLNEVLATDENEVKIAEGLVSRAKSGDVSACKLINELQLAADGRREDLDKLDRILEGITAYCSVS